MLLAALSCAAALRPLVTTTCRASDGLGRKAIDTNIHAPHTHTPCHTISTTLATHADVNGERATLAKDTHTIGSSRRAAGGAIVVPLIDRTSFAAAAALVHLALAGGVTPVAHAESPPSSSSPLRSA